MGFEEVKAVIAAECDKHGIEFFHSDEETVTTPFDNLRCNGFFYGDNDSVTECKLHIGTNNNSLKTLVHEFCHMEQYLESVKVWTDLIDNGHLWPWLDGNDVDCDLVRQSVLAHYNVELDCERRSVEKHIEWKTGIDIDEYIQQANAYTLFYFYVLENRKWYIPGKEPYSIEAVWRKMPTTFDFDPIACYHAISEYFEMCVKG